MRIIELYFKYVGKVGCIYFCVYPFAHTFIYLLLELSTVMIFREENVFLFFILKSILYNDSTIIVHIRTIIVHIQYRIKNRAKTGEREWETEKWEKNREKETIANTIDESNQH